MNGDATFREILGVPVDATRDQIRQAYRLRVMENHPDRFPPDRKHLQELTTITLTEAYSALMRGMSDGREPAASPGASKTRAAASESVRAPASVHNGVRHGVHHGAHAASRHAASPRDSVPADALTLPRDPAYAWYKQGFINFSLAIHGIAAVNRKIAAGRTLPSRRRFNTAEYFGTSLSYLRAAHGYFTRVVEEYAESVWVADSRFKLRRIEGLTAIYRRILRNVRFR